MAMLTVRAIILHSQNRRLIHGPDYIKLDKASSTVIVLAQTDDRYIKGLHGDLPMWLLDFLVYEKESKELVGVSGISLGSQRSVSCEVHLEAGEYIVLVSIWPISMLLRYINCVICSLG